MSTPFITQSDGADVASDIPLFEKEDLVPIKRCTGCQRDLPGGCTFYAKDPKTRDGLNYWCKRCVNDAKKKRRAKPIPAGMQWCNACAKPVDIAQFDDCKKSCRECRQKQKDLCAAKSREQCRAKDKLRYPKRKGKLWLTSIKKNYGLTPARFWAIYESQFGKCAICKIAFSALQSRECHIDHDHSTGIVRGILCINCNNGLGRFLDNPKSLRRAATYLDKHASRQQQADTDGNLLPMFKDVS